MGADAKTEIPADTRLYLDEIAKRLWSGHAAVMVGAGFSKNASSTFPDWKQLADRLCRKGHGHELGPDKDRYLNPLKLASEVEAVFGRPALEDLLGTSIPGLDVPPSELHGRLMELPWTDVFTVNYDSLLERTSGRYHVVRNARDLIWSDQPRIVKLHGSLPGDSLIITEEDYRTYPRVETRLRTSQTAFCTGRVPPHWRMPCTSTSQPGACPSRRCSSSGRGHAPTRRSSPKSGTNGRGSVQCRMGLGCTLVRD